MAESKTVESKQDIDWSQFAQGDKLLLEKNASDEKTQAARLRALVGKRLLYVSGSGLYPSFGASLRDHVKKMIKLGVHITMVFQKDLKNDKYFSNAEQNECFHAKIFADMKGSQAAENIAQAVRESCIEPFDGVWTPHEATQKLNAQVQKLLGCVGNDPASYDLAQNKYATRRALEKAGINTLKAAQIWDLDDCANAATVVGFPLICKPSTGMGSSGVYKVESMLELEAAVTRILDDIKNSWTLSNCTGGDCTAGKPKQAPILAETFVDPITFGKDGLITEFDVECLVWDGKLVYANVVDNWRTLAPYFQDRGFNAPSVSPEQVQKEMIEYSAAAVEALGFTRGNFHMECWYTTSGPILIEANPRVGGGAIDITHERVWGVSPMDNFVMAMLDIPINPTRVLDPNAKYGFALVNAEKTGAISDSEFCPSSKDSAIVTDVMQFKFAGDNVVGLDTGVPEWLAQIDYESKGQETSVQDFLDEMARVMDICVSNASRNTTPRLL